MISRSLWLRAAAGIGAGAVAAAVLAGAGFSRFAPHRTKLVNESRSPTDGRVVVSSESRPDIAQLPSPVAVIARIRNGSSERLSFQLEHNGRRFCDADVPGGGERRIDCVLTEGWSGAAEHVFAVSSTAPTWSLEYFEVATHFGRSSGLVALYVLPRSTPYPKPGLMWIAFAWLAVAALLFVRPPGPLHGWLRLAFAIGAGLVCVGLLVVVAAPWISPYRIVLSTRSVLGCAAFLLAPRLFVAGRWAADRGRAAIGPQRTPVAIGFAVALIVSSAFLMVMSGRVRDFYQGNYSGLLLISRDAFDRNPLVKDRADIRATLVLLDSGYDGQFMYFAIFDPFLREYHDQPVTYRFVMDLPPYRYGRIGFSLLTKFVSFDRWQWYPATMAGLVIAGLFALAFVLTDIARRARASPWWALLVVAVPGFWPSLLSGLPEPIAAALLVAGYWAVLRDRWISAGVLLAGSLLVRETGVVFVGLLVVAAYLSGRRRAALIGGALAFTPLIAWRTYVGLTLFPDFRWQAFFPIPHDLGLPLAGFVDLWRVVARGAYFPGLEQSAMWYPVVLVAAFVVAVVLAVRRPSALSIATVVYATIAISLNYASIWVHVGNGQRGTFEVFVMLALSTIGQPLSRPLSRAMVAFWSLTVVYVFFWSPDAAFIRGTIFFGL